MRRTIVTALLLTAFTASAAGQTGSDACGIRIGLLTCSPGTELYSTFGHSALRITDSATGTDIVYNYGVFDFYDPQFYTKFVRGRLLYFLDREDFADFLRNYAYEDRTVSEQVLDIDCARKAEIRRFLEENLRPENRSYKYDFLFDNCTTRLRDLILGNAGPGAVTASILPSSDRTFRDHIHHYLDRNRMHWSKLGIDILLGSPLDRAMSNQESMFLPDYLETGIDSTWTATYPLVATREIHYTRQSPPPGESPAIPPTALAFGAAAALMAWASLSKGKRIAASVLALGDFLLYFLAGAVGLLLVFMWTGTDHRVCRENYNLLWAIPTHVLAAFLIRRKGSATAWYFLVTAALSVLLLLAWYFLPQRLNPALALPVALLAWRGWAISREARRMDT